MVPQNVGKLLPDYMASVAGVSIFTLNLLKNGYLSLDRFQAFVKLSKPVSQCNTHQDNEEVHISPTKGT